MKYKIINNSSDGFWEDGKNKSFGLGKDLIIKLFKNIITIKGSGVDAFLERSGKRAKVSKEGQVMKGMVEDKDRLWLSDKVEIEFIDRKKIKFKPPKINWNLWVGILVLMTLIVLIFLGWKKRTETNIENNYISVMLGIKGNIDKSENIKSIDPETSLKLLNEAKEKIQSLKDNKIHENEIAEIKKIINEKLATGGSSDVVSYSEVYNTKISDTVDQKYDKFLVSGETGILMDSTTRKVVEINLNSLQLNKFDVSKEILNIVGLMTVNKKIYVYDGQYIWDLNNNKTADLGEEIFSKIYNWNNSWYLLGQDGKIKKYSNNKVDDWTKSEATVNNLPVDMTIDGTIWVVSSEGKVWHYEGGKSVAWDQSARIWSEKIIGISTTANSDVIAVLSDKKVYVFEKSSGKLVASHNFEKVGIVAGQMGNNNQIYVLGQDQKIYKVK